MPIRRKATASPVSRYQAASAAKSAVALKANYPEAYAELGFATRKLEQLRPGTVREWCMSSNIRITNRNLIQRAGRKFAQTMTAPFSPNRSASAVTIFRVASCMASDSGL